MFRTMNSKVMFKDLYNYPYVIIRNKKFVWNIYFKYLME